MGDKSIDPKVIKKTQDTLGKVISKPPMSEKILARPTVQYMYDVLISVMKTTGKMKGLFNDTELNFENIKGSKEDKVVFFQKAIDYVSLVTGKPVSVKPSKILAGHEPEKTNEFLQVLAEAARKNIDNDDYVRRVLKSDDSKVSSSKKESSRSKESSKGDRGSGDNQEKEDRHRSKDRSKDRNDRDKRDSEVIDFDKEDRKERGEKHRSKDKDRDDRGREKDKDRDHRDRDRDRHDRDRHDKKDRDKDRDGRSKDKEERSRDKDERSKDREERSKDKEERSKDRGEKSKDREARSKDREERLKEKDDDDNGDSEQHRLQRPSSAKGSRRHQTRGSGSGDSRREDETPKEQPSRMAPQSAAGSRPTRPSSARPAPPKPKKNELKHEESAIGMLRPNVIVDRRQDSDDDDDAFVAKEEEIALPPELVVAKADEENTEENEADHGGLVKKLLESKKEQEATQPKKTEIERVGGVMDASRRKERELANKEIETLKKNIQETTQHVHPLGRLLDLVQENLDSMQKELEMWKNEHSQNIIELQQKQSISNSSLEPLRAELREIDGAIVDQLDLIAAVKNNIYQNENKISKMLNMIAKS